MNKKLLDFNQDQRKNKSMPEIKTGYIVKVYRKIKEGSKERIQIFEGMVIAKKGGQSSSPMITVRKVSGGVGVELVLPIFSPSIEKIEVVKKAKIRRSKLYYIRDKSAKSLRLKYKDMADFANVEEEEAIKKKDVENENEDNKAAVDDKENKEKKVEKEGNEKSVSESNKEKEKTEEDK
ncbi:MAG: 50S ribosomal protein L19 [Candidatus Moraniibacteriota bacterium]